MEVVANNFYFHDLQPAPDDFHAEVIAGLSGETKLLSPKFFYDERGSQLFDAITRLPEYYPTRTEIGLLNRYREDIARMLGDDGLLIELGSGSDAKMRVLLEAIQPIAYAPIDISHEPLRLAAGAIACTLLAFALVQGVRLLGGPQPAKPGGAVINTAGADIGGSFTLTDTSGKRVSDKDFRGRYMLIYFGYSFCPDVCPTELQAMGRALDLLGPAAEKIVPVFISVDPARDKGKELADYVRAFHPRMVGLTGARADIDAVTKAYRVYYKLGAPSKAGATDYLVDHTAFVYLVGPDGTLAALLRGGSGPDALAQGIRSVLR